MTVRNVHAGPPPSCAELANAGSFAMMVDGFSPMTAPDGAGCAEPVTYSTVEADGTELTLFLHRRRDTTERRPGIVFVHGGGWTECGPGLHIGHAHAFAAKGYVTANINYRLAPAWPWPAAIDDVAEAIRWMRRSAPELGLDPHRIAVSGGSAGGHLSAMAALRGVEDPTSAVQAAVLWYPATDLRSFDGDPVCKPMVDALLPEATAEDMLRASPLGNVHAAAPPIVTMTGDIDPVTKLVDIEKFHERLTEVGIRNRLEVFEGRDHGFDYHPTDWHTCVDLMSAFLEEIFSPTT